METKFENGNSFRNLTIKGVFLEKEWEWGHKFEVEREDKAWERGWGVKGLGNTTLIIIAECW